MNRPPAANPFPSSAVARFSSIDAESLLTVSTDAVSRATALLDEYLSAGAVEGESGPGRVVAVVGEYGTGKTHLALTMLHRLALSGEVKSLYLDAPADTFLSLYRERFIPRLSRADVRRTIEEYYADIVAEDLQESELTLPLAAELRARSVEPLALVRRVGLMEAKYQGLLTQHLAKITEDPSFGVALSLFLRPEFEAAVWEWLCGSPPDSALVERGVTSTLDTDANALQAMGVIALLYGGQRRRFVVVFDEMEKILGDGSPAEQADGVLAAFKRMLEIFSQTGALLILCGLPDFLEALPEDSLQRISVTIKPNRLTATDAVRFIEDVNERATGERTLKPFSTDVAAYLADLSGGNARRLVRLCYYAYADAVGTGTDVTRAIVREAAREQFELVSQDSLRGDIVRVISRNGWRFETNRPLAKGKAKRRLDYWIPLSHGGCAVFLTQSVLQKVDATNLVNVSRLVGDDQGMQPAKRILIVNGYLSDEFRPTLESQFDSIVTHNVHTFSEDLDAVLQGAVARLEKEADAVSFDTLSAKLDQSVRQNSLILSGVESLADRLLEQPTLQTAVEHGLTSVFATLSGARPSSRFPSVDRIFDELNHRFSLFPTFADCFALPLVESPEYFNEEVLSAISSLASMRALVQSFREAVGRLLNSQRSFSSALFRRYDDLVGSYSRHISTIDLVAVRQLRGPRSIRDDDYQISEELLESFRSLARDVYDAAERGRGDLHI